jgi:thioredoxin reductase
LSNPSAIDVAIVGAGPYGLSLAAHMGATRRPFRIFGEPMKFWSQRMPKGMRLKSEGFASNLSDPKLQFTLGEFCRQRGIDYADIGLPVALETFVEYGREFQRRFVPALERVEINQVSAGPAGFDLLASSGECVRAQRVVVATGIGAFEHLPPPLKDLPQTLVSHSSHHCDLTSFKSAKVLVLGAGASALDIAALLRAGGARAELLARTDTLKFHDPPCEPRPLLERLREPRSGLGTGWRSRLSCDVPLIFHALPESVRLRAVARHLGPAPCWFVREAVAGMPMHLGATLVAAEPVGGQIRVHYRQEGQDKTLEADHLISATGFKVALSRLGLLHESLKQRIKSVVDSPMLNRRFESTVPGLYFVGISAANSFGPLLRFAFGADYTARRLARHLASG